MSYKILHKWNTQRKDSQNQRIFIESLYLLTKLNLKEPKEFMLMSSSLIHAIRVYRGWDYKGKHSEFETTSTVFNFLQYWLSKRFIFMVFSLMKVQMTVRRLGISCINLFIKEEISFNRGNESYWIICNNATIHRSKLIVEFLTSNNI